MASSKQHNESISNKSILQLAEKRFTTTKRQKKKNADSFFLRDGCFCKVRAYEYIYPSLLRRNPWLLGIKQAQQIGLSDMSPGAVVVGGGGAETPAVCCVPPRCACGPLAGPCVAEAAWPRLRDRLRRGGRKNPPTPRGLQQGPLAGHAAPLAARTPSAGSWENMGEYSDH